MSTARRILLADGDPVARKSFEETLSGKGHAVVTASSGEDALWHLDNGTFDAIFTELAMRGIGGLDLVEEIRARHPGLPVVIIAGHASAADQEGAAAAGVAEFLRKPLSPEQLAETAERVLRAAKPAAGLPPRTPVAEVAPVPATGTRLSRLKDVGLFLLAPFVALVYLLAFPILALGMALWTALQPSEVGELLQPATAASPGVLKTVAMMLAAILIGIFFAVIGPLIGIGFLVWFGIEAWGKLGAKAIS